MEYPKAIRCQLKHYEAHGYTPVEAKPRAGSHWLVRFAEFTQPQIVTACKTDWRGWKNNLARYRKLASQAMSGSPMDASTLS
jgi:hypothetical protein